jgi:outer membrane protein OmpA-like peptidoglycan-associated protein
MRVMDEQIAKYGQENIVGIEVVGHASRLGDTEPNITLSEGRAKYIADLLKRLYKVKIPDDNIKFRGEPIEEGNNRDNSWKDRVVWVTINAVKTVSP